ncbi:MAG TPA: hypothetical protein VG942_19195 [Hyphomonadaceae bacterium]|nr:hypothetical protein [Hyphomonadaceae bacterium]
MPVKTTWLLSAAAIAISSFGSIAVAQAPPAVQPSQQAAPAQPAYTPTEKRAQPNLPRTSFGQPSLEGAWGSNWVLPLEASPRVPMLVVPAAAAKQIAAGYAKGVGDALDKQLDPEVPETMRQVEGLPTVLGEYRTRAIVIPANGMLPYTAAGKAELSRGNGIGDLNNPEGRPNWERCVRSLGQPPVFPIGSGNPREIIQTPNAVVIHTEYGNEARVIPYTDKHKPKMFWDLLGDSIAHWEGNTLVIETIGLPDRDRVRLFPSFIVSSEAVVTERYTRLAMDELLYQFTVTDPKVYTETWMGEYSIYPLTGNGRLFEHACHEGNYSMPNILKGARVLEERKARAAQTAQATPVSAKPAQ